MYDKSKKGPRKAGFVFLCIILSLLLVAGGFVLGVYLTYNGVLDDFLRNEESGITAEQQAEIDSCNGNQTEIAEALASYIDENGIYIDKTTIVIIERSEDGADCTVTVDGDCLSSEECEVLLGDDCGCPAGGVCVAEIIPYIDDAGVSMFKIEVTCDGVSGEWSHS
jgi:hypothetical protein